METPAIAFRYFQDPRRYSPYVVEARPCELCGQIRAGYEGPFYGETEVENWADFVCEECIATGKLTERELKSNSVDGRVLLPGLESRYPELPSVERERMAADRTQELEDRTPGMLTWQDLEWPAHCGDYCRFLKEADQCDFNTLASDGDGRAFFYSHLEDDPKDAGIEWVWEWVIPEMGDRLHEGSPEAYLFQCLHCGEYVVQWDHC